MYTVPVLYFVKCWWWYVTTTTINHFFVSYSTFILQGFLEWPNSRLEKQWLFVTLAPHNKENKHTLLFSELVWWCNNLGYELSKKKIFAAAQQPQRFFFLKGVIWLDPRSTELAALPALHLGQTHSACANLEKNFRPVSWKNVNKVPELNELVHIKSSITNILSKIERNQ